ncbi:class I SAM-dependent methyltransferase [Kribbella sp. CA-253562]|uniref:class I SAM-dependent methyltransferase n=1 Tax=Kribbella sp. CA-253562 TaxID=3239942 RepID=UPI003D8E9B62
MNERALSFGSVAAAYERYRPGYPDELVDAVLDYAQGPRDSRRPPVRTALEIGAGTGKATRAFAARGVAVTATEPDAAMLAELRRQVPAASFQSTFEELPVGPTYDLVFAAAALHWTDPAGRWERVAALLNPRGTFASFGGPLQLADPTIEQAVRSVTRRYLDSDDIPSPDGTPSDSPMQWPGTELLRSPLFTDVRQSTIERRVTMSDHEYVAHLSTISAYLQLPEPARLQVLAEVLQVLPLEVTMNADLTLHLARRSA